MKHKIFILTIILSVFFYARLIAQDTVHINEVIKFENRQTVFNNSNEEVVDSTVKLLNKNSSIDELLSIQTSSQIKSYGGLGNLSSISLRGSGANHVSVNWNGFPINSGTTGGTDLSLIQAGFFETIKLIPGASSSLYGNGTFGGALELNNSYNYKKGLNIGIGSEIGSFETYKHFIQTSFSNIFFQYKFSANKISAKNNFPFYNNYKFDNPLEKREHNKLNSLNIIQSLSLKLPQNNTFESGIWYILKDKEIPEIAGSYGIGNKMQTDSIFRTYARWKKKFKKSLLTLSSAFFSEHMHYTDKANNYDTVNYTDSEIDVKNISCDISYRCYFNNNLTIDFASIINYQKVNTLNYNTNQPEEINYSLLTAFKYKILKSNFSFNFRNEFSENIKYIPVFDFGFIKKICKNKVILKSKISNKFRRPTFNEKYWNPGGNPNIKNETGNSADASINYYFTKTRNSNISVTTYYSKIQDMIQWIPKDGIWTAVNNKEVKISGIETNFLHIIKTGMLNHNIQASYSLTNSLLTDIYSNENYNVIQRLVYTPQNNAKFFVTSSYKNFTFSFSEQYTGKRFTTQENNEDNVLPDYFLSNIYLSYQADIKHFNIAFNIKFLNILNKQYEMIKSYPSSGRAVYFSIALTYKKKSK